MGTAAVVVGAGIVGALLLGLSQRQKMVMEYGKLTDRKWQRSEYGGDVPRSYGTTGLPGSQVGWMENNELKERVKKKKSGGKGGSGGQVIETYTYSATFILILAEGKYAGIRRIWCQDKLIYNAGSDDLETIIASNKKAKGWKFYNGADDQMPDPRYEAQYGPGNVPAYRGFAYLAFYDFQLKDYGNSLEAAQFKVELVKETTPQFKPVAELTIPYDRFSQRFSPQPFFIGSEEVIWYWPTWDNNYVSPGFADKYVFRPGGSSYDGRVSAGNIASAVPPIGTDDEGIFYKDPKEFYPAYSGLFTTKFRARGNYVALGFGTNAFVDFGQYKGSGFGASPFVHITGQAYAADVHDDTVFIVNLTMLRHYDKAGVLLGQVTHGMPLVNGLGVKLFTGEDALYCYTGAPNFRIYRIAFDLSHSELVCTLPSDGNVDVVDFCVDRDVVTRTILASDTGKMIVQWYNLAYVDAGRETLQSVIAAECGLSGLITDADLDLSMLNQEVRGYSVSGGSIRSSIESLQGVFPFDVRPHGYQLQFVPRGQAPVATVPWQYLSASDSSDPGDSLPYSREMDAQLPQRVTITAISADREYGASAQSSPGRPDTDAVNEEDMNVNVVLTDDEVAQAAERIEMVRWLERRDYEGSLPPIFLGLEAADVVTVQAKFGDFELRIVEPSYGPTGIVTFKAKENRAPIYASTAVGAPAPGSPGTIPLDGPSLFVPMDIPLIDESIQNDPGFVGAMTGFSSGWPGASLVRSNDNGQTWSELQGFVGEATIARALGTLPASPCTLIDQRSLIVMPVSGEFESITRDQMLLGMNYAAYGVDGRWEIVRFQNAVLQADGSYLLSGFVRGDKGTEWSSGLHQYGDFFILLDDPDNTVIDLPIESIGLPRLYRGVTSGGSIDDADDVPFTYQGVNLECLSPVYARATRSSGNLSGTFTRRSRFSSSWWTNGVPAIVGEASESYEIDVMSGSTVKRTIPTTSAAWIYSAADQTTDFGSPQSSITFRIYQLSATVGRGYLLEATL